MNSATLKRNPEVLPESIMERPSARSIVVVEKLLTDSALATVATRLLSEHGPSFIAFLLEAVRLQELEAETLETAFKARFLASTNTWESLRGDMIEGIVEAANRRAKEDSEFKRNLEADSVEMFRRFAATITVVSIVGTAHAFTNGPLAVPPKGWAKRKN